MRTHYVTDAPLAERTAFLRELQRRCLGASDRKIRLVGHQLGKRWRKLNPVEFDDLVDRLLMKVIDGATKTDDEGCSINHQLYSELVQKWFYMNSEFSERMKTEDAS